MLFISWGKKAKAKTCILLAGLAAAILSTENAAGSFRGGFNLWFWK
jgi:hypothetical protein